MTFGRWLLGVVLLAAIASTLAFGARAVRRRFLPELQGATAVLADAVIAVSALVVLAELLGVAGILDPVPLVLGAVAAGAGGIALGRRGRPAEAGASGAVGRSGTAAAGGRGVVLTWISFAGAALVVAAWVRRTLVSLDLGVGGVDSLWYHLPFAAKFAREGSVTAIPYVDLEFLTAFYPANVELVHAVGMVLFGTAALSPLLSLAALLLALLAGWCLGRPFGVAPLTLLATAIVVGVPAVYETQAGEAKNDIAAIAFLLAAAALLVSARPRPAILAICGAAAGLALGTKLSFLAPVAALAAVAVWLARGERPGRGAAAFAAGAAATGGYWYLRNLFATGNPLPWLGPLPQPAEARSEHTATTLADYLTDGHAWSTYFLPSLDDVLGPMWPVMIALGAVGLAMGLAKGDPRLRALAIVGVVAAVAYVITPSSAAGPEAEPVGFGLNVRYVLPAVLLGLAVLAAMTKRRADVVAGVFTLVLLVTQLAPDPIWAPEHRRKAIALLVIGLAGAVVATRVKRPGALAAAAVVASVALLWPLERDFLDDQYTVTRPPYTAWRVFNMGPVYDWARDQHGARIAVTGTTGAYFQFPLHGPELDNQVQVVGEHGAHGSFTQTTTCDRARERARGQHPRRRHAVPRHLGPVPPARRPGVSLPTHGRRAGTADQRARARLRAQPMTTVSVVVPAFQEARRIPRLIRAVHDHARTDLRAAGLTLHEVIVVDDGSTDGTGAVLADAAEKEPLLRALTAPPGRRGKGHALAHGIRQASGHLVLLADVDLSAPLSETHKLAAELHAGADVAVGSRALEGAAVDGTPLSRELMGRTFNALVRTVTALDLRDTQCPLKLMPTTLAHELTEHQIAAGFAYDVELLLRARRHGARVVEVPIEFHHDRDSRVRPLVSAASMAYDVLRLSVRLRGHRKRHAERQIHPLMDEPGLGSQR